MARSPADHIELRCQRRKHAEVEPGATGTLRIHCRDCSRRGEDGVVVIHHFDLATGEYITRKYRDPSELLNHSAVSAAHTEGA